MAFSKDERLKNVLKRARDMRLKTDKPSDVQKFLQRVENLMKTNTTSETLDSDSPFSTRDEFANTIINDSLFADKASHIYDNGPEAFKTWDGTVSYLTMYIGMGRTDSELKKLVLEFSWKPKRTRPTYAVSSLREKNNRLPAADRVDEAMLKHLFITGCRQKKKFPVNFRITSI
ncbi:hypothetical protein BC829DRAFT_424297, partial [Chytridium lagenaria]